MAYRLQSTKYVALIGIRADQEIQELCSQIKQTKEETEYQIGAMFGWL